MRGQPSGRQMTCLGTPLRGQVLPAILPAPCRGPHLLAAARALPADCSGQPVQRHNAAAHQQTSTFHPAGQSATRPINHLIDTNCQIMFLNKLQWYTVEWTRSINVNSLCSRRFLIFHYHPLLRFLPLLSLHEHNPVPLSKVSPLSWNSLYNFIFYSSPTYLYFPFPQNI